MEPPKNVQVTETYNTTYWFDENGILCSVSKKVPPLPLEEMKKTLEEFRDSLQGRKICVLLDITDSNETSKELRDYAAAEFPTFIKAVAIISGSELGKMLANLFFNLKQQPYPAMFFDNEADAKEWLKQYL